MWPNWASANRFDGRNQRRRSTSSWNSTYRRPLRGAFIKPPPQGAVADACRACPTAWRAPALWPHVRAAKAIRGRFGLMVEHPPPQLDLNARFYCFLSVLSTVLSTFFRLFADFSTAVMEVEGRCRPNEIRVFCRSPRSNSPVGWRPPARAPLLGGGPARRRSRPGGRPALEALPADPVDFFETASSKPMTASLFTGST